MTFLEFLKTDRNSRKIFGKMELKIIEKQLLGINLTQSEKNRLSRDIRPKFEFIEKGVKYSDWFALKKAAIISRIVDDVKGVILGDILSRNIEEIVLFGSAVENTLTFNSDIDIAVKFSNIDLKEATLFRKRVLGKVDSRVDIQVYNLLPDKIKKSIDDNKRWLYKNEDKR